MLSSLKPVSFFLCFVLVICFGSSAQKSPSRVSQLYRQADSLMSRRFKNTLQPKSGIPFTQAPYFKQQSFRVREAPVKRNMPNQKNILNSVETPAGAVCMDTSMRLVYRKDSSWFANDYLTKTRDGNILIPGFDYNNFKSETDAHLVKCTQQGDTLWSISIQGGYHNYFMDVYRAFELSDGSILLTGD